MGNEFMDLGQDKQGWKIYIQNEWTQWAENHGIVLEKQKVSRNRERHAGSNVYLKILVSHNLDTPLKTM